MVTSSRISLKTKLNWLFLAGGSWHVIISSGSNELVYVLTSRTGIVGRSPRRRRRGGLTKSNEDGLDKWGLRSRWCVEYGHILGPKSVWIGL